MIKVAYISKIQLSDVDFSYLHELQKIADVTIFMEVTPRFAQGPAFNIKELYPKTGVFKLSDAYPECQKYADYLDIDKFYVVNTVGGLWQLKAFWTNLLLLFCLLKGGFNAIHLAWAPNIYEFFIYVLRKKLLLTVHDPFPHTGLDTFIVRLRRKVAFMLIPKLLILNRAQRQDFLNYYGLKESRIINSRLSVYSYLKTVKPDEYCLPKGRFILFVGKISQYKGADYLLPAMIEVHKEYPDYTLVMAGSGKYHFDISQYNELDYIDIRNRFIPDDELVALISHSEFIVCPYTDATQSGVIMSAFAFSKPVLATNVGGLPEMVRNNEYGIIVKEKDVNALVDGIKYMFAQPEKLVEYSENIKHAYESGEMSWKQIAENLLAEYTKM